MKIDKQVKFIQLMGNLLGNGFHLGEVIHFLKLTGWVEGTFIGKMESGLAEGQTLSGILEGLNFSKNVVTQVALAEIHGDLSGTLQLIEVHLRQQLKTKRKLIEVATYPLLLLVFLIGILLALKHYLFPQLDGKTTFALVVINHLPTIFLGGISSLGILTGLSVLFFRRQSAIEGVINLAKMPLFSQWIRLYLTAYFSREWGNLIAQGVELQQILQVMQAQKSRIFAEVGTWVDDRMKAGATFEQAVSDLPLFLPELAMMIKYGAMKDKLGIELSVYADDCWERFFIKINRAMQWIQPLVFIFVALMIVLLYVAMLLPIYSNMGMGG